MTLKELEKLLYKSKTNIDWIPEWVDKTEKVHQILETTLKLTFPDLSTEEMYALFFSVLKRKLIWNKIKDIDDFSEEKIKNLREEKQKAIEKCIEEQQDKTNVKDLALRERAMKYAANKNLINDLNKLLPSPPNVEIIGEYVIITNE